MEGRAGGLRVEGRAGGLRVGVVVQSRRSSCAQGAAHGPISGVHRLPACFNTVLSISCSSGGVAMLGAAGGNVIKERVSVYEFVQDSPRLVLGFRQRGNSLHYVVFGKGRSVKRCLSHHSQDELSEKPQCGLSQGRPVRRTAAFFAS